MRYTQRISAKLDKFRPSLTLGLKALVQERAARGLPVYDFGLGETKGHLNPEIRAAGEQDFRRKPRRRHEPVASGTCVWLTIVDAPKRGRPAGASG